MKEYKSNTGRNLGYVAGAVLVGKALLALTGCAGPEVATAQEQLNQARTAYHAKDIIGKISQLEGDYEKIKKDGVTNPAEIGQLLAIKTAAAELEKTDAMTKGHKATLAALKTRTDGLEASIDKDLAGLKTNGEQYQQFIIYVTGDNKATSTVGYRQGANMHLDGASIADVAAVEPTYDQDRALARNHSNGKLGILPTQTMDGNVQHLRYHAQEIDQENWKELVKLFPGYEEKDGKIVNYGKLVVSDLPGIPGAVITGQKFLRMVESGELGRVYVATIAKEIKVEEKKELSVEEQLKGALADRASLAARLNKLEEGNAPEAPAQPEAQPNENGQLPDQPHVPPIGPENKPADRPEGDSSKPSKKPGVGVLDE